MSGADTITHPGIIEKVEQKKILVKIYAQSACAACHAKGMCSVADMEEKTVEIANYHGHAHKKGDMVTVRMEKSLGSKAVFLGYFLPFLLVMATLILVVSITSMEGLAGLLSLLILAPYYLALYLLKDKLSKQFTFRID